MEQEVLRSDEIAVENESRNEDCEPSCRYQGTHSGDVILEDYPNCPVRFEVDWCISIDVIDGEQVPVVNFGDIDWGRINQNIAECEELWDDLRNIISNGTALEQQFFINDIYAQAYSQLTDQWFENNATSSGSLVNCGQVGSQQHFNFVRNSYMANCYQVCLFADGTFERNACGQSCCTITTGYCLDPVTGEIVTEVFESTDVLFGNCSNLFLGCQGKDGETPIAVSPCLNTCE